MLLKHDIENILQSAIDNGADFSEIFLENTIENKYLYKDNKIDSIESNNLKGIGIRITKDVKYVYLSSSNLNVKNLINLVKDACLSLSKKETNNQNVSIDNFIQTSNKLLFETSIDKKIKLLKNCHDITINYNSLIKLVQTSLYECKSNIIIANSNGLFKTDERNRTRLYITSNSQNENKNQSISNSFGRTNDFSIFDDFDINKICISTAKSSVDMLYSKDCPAGTMPVAIESGFGGVIFHEACGHSLEGYQINKQSSEFVNKLGEKIAHEKLTVIDDGSINNMWGSLSFDDEGNDTKRNVLIENGVLKSYMLDDFNAQKLNKKSTSNCRRQNYKFAPSSRMTNTFIDSGTDTKEDIIKSIDYGIYAKKMGGGQVNTVTGDFNFAVTEAYLVKNGEILYPVSGATLIGKGSEIIRNIDMVSDNLELSEGICGSVSGNIPVCVGQPLIRVNSIIVGGKS